VQQLHPTPHPADLTALYAGLTLPTPPQEDGCWVALCMVSSLDGAAAVEGRSGGLGGEADRLALSRLRDATDAVLVGAATVRDEGYGPLTGNERRRADRRARGLAEIPRLAIVTRSGDLDPEAAVFGDEAQRPLVLATARGAEVARPRLGEHAEVVALGEDEVEPRAALAHLASLGLRRVVCEGGPRLAAQVLAQDLVDEVFLTLAPIAVAGAAPRIAEQPGTEVPRHMRLVSVWEHDGELFLRYRHSRHFGT
jgi:riboflavin biosynthesis pyrimidine reductase